MSETDTLLTRIDLDAGQQGVGLDHLIAGLEIRMIEKARRTNVRENQIKVIRQGFQYGLDYALELGWTREGLLEQNMYPPTEGVRNVFENGAGGIITMCIEDAPQHSLENTPWSTLKK